MGLEWGSDVDPGEYVIRLAAVDGHGAEALTVAGAPCLGVAHYGGDSRELEAKCTVMRRRVAYIYLIVRGRQGCPQIGGEAGVGPFAVVDDDLDFANVAAAAPGLGREAG